MKKLFLNIFLLLPILAFPQGEIFRYAQEVAKQQKAVVPSLLPPPLSDNVNTELITDNAASFPPNELDEVNGSTGNLISNPTGGSVTVTSENVDDGYQGDFVVRVAANTYTGGFARAEHLDVAALSNSTTYDYALLYRQSGTGASGRFRVVDGSTTVLEINTLSQTEWTLLTGTFNSTASAGLLDVSVWCHRPFVSANGTEWIEYKLTIKEQD